MVSLVSDAEDGVHREVGGAEGHAVPLPDGCLGAYLPGDEPADPPLASRPARVTPASKSVAVRIKTA